MYAAFEQLEQVTFWGMAMFAPEMVCVIKPRMLLIDRVVVADWTSLSSSVTQSEFADVLCNNVE